MKIRKLKYIKWKIKRRIKKTSKYFKNKKYIFKKNIIVNVKNIKLYYDYSNPFLRKDKNIKTYFHKKKIIKKCNIKRDEIYKSNDFFRKHNQILYSKLYFGLISRLCNPYPRPNNMVLDEYLGSIDYTYSTKILAKYNSRYIFDTYIWKKLPYKCMKIKSNYYYKNIMIKKIIMKNPHLYYYIFFKRNCSNQGYILVGFYKKMNICIMMDCRFDKSFIKKKYKTYENKEISFFNEIIKFIQKEYKGKIILNDYKNDLQCKNNIYDYQHFSVNYSKKYEISWYESKLGFIKNYGTEYCLE